MTTEATVTLTFTKEELNHLLKCLASYEALAKPTGDTIHSRMSDKLYEADEEFGDDGS